MRAVWPCVVGVFSRPADRLGIGAGVPGSTGPAPGGSVGRTLRRRGRNFVQWWERSFDAGVPPASFDVNGSQGPPCDPTIALGKHARRALALTVTKESSNHQRSHIREPES